MKRFKVQYGKEPRTNKWGHFLPKDQQPPTYTEYFETLDEAMKFASKIHTKKVGARIYDCDGSNKDGDSNSHTWLVGAWERLIYYPNDNYNN